MLGALPPPHPGPLLPLGEERGSRLMQAAPLRQPKRWERPPPSPSAFPLRPRGPRSGPQRATAPRAATHKDLAMIGTGLRSSPERATARRADRRVSQASGASARRLREMNKSERPPSREMNKLGGGQGEVGALGAPPSSPRPSPPPRGGEGEQADAGCPSPATKALGAAPALPTCVPPPPLRGEGDRGRWVFRPAPGA